MVDIKKDETKVVYEVGQELLAHIQFLRDLKAGKKQTRWELIHNLTFIASVEEPSIKKAELSGAPTPQLIDAQKDVAQRKAQIQGNLMLLDLDLNLLDAEIKNLDELADKDPAVQSIRKSKMPVL